MRLLRRGLMLAGVVGVVLLPAGAARAFPQHLHCITTPNGTVHAIAGGVTFHAPHDTAFHNLHSNVHLGAFAKNPIPLAADTTAPFTCPPS